MDWLEENGGTIAVIGIIIFFGWLFISNSSNNSAPSKSTDSYESSNDSSNYEQEVREEPEEFHGYECSDDCSGHDAGYEWADENGVCDEYFDGGNSESFAEGVRIYAEENC